VRALFLENFNFKNHSEVNVEGEDFHHLKNVLRIKNGEDVLLLNGLGVSCHSKVISISKNSLVLEIHTISENKNVPTIDLALGHIKKEALVEAIKKSVECRYGSLYLFHCDYAQKSNLKPEKLKKILKNSYEQSNAKHMLNVQEFKNFGEIELNEYKAIFLFNSVKSEARVDTSSINGKCLVVIGPEGGFSEVELEKFRQIEHLVEIYADTNIMRSPTACSYAKGHVQSLLNMRI